MLSPNFQICPLKMDQFFLIVTQKARINAPISQVAGKILKKTFVLFQFCNVTGGLPDFIMSHVDICGVPTIGIDI